MKIRVNRQVAICLLLLLALSAPAFGQTFRGRGRLGGRGGIGGGAANPLITESWPTQVQSFVSLGVPDTAGFQTYMVGPGQTYTDIQAAIDQAIADTATTGSNNPGAVIRILPGNTFASPSSQYQAKARPNTPDGRPIVIRSDSAEFDAGGDYPPGMNAPVPAAAAAEMPKITTARDSSSTGAALIVNPSAKDYYFIGLEVTVTTAVSTGPTLVEVGVNNSAQDTLAEQPLRITFDRCYVHGLADEAVFRGFNLNGSHVAVVNCRVAEIHGIGMETQAILLLNGSGPYDIRHSYLEGATENFMAGGGDNQSDALLPRDIVFYKNRVPKNIAWKDALISQPTSVSATPGTGGSLAANTYHYKVVAVGTFANSSTVRSALSAAVSATVSAGGTVTITMTAPIRNNFTHSSWIIYRSTSAIGASGSVSKHAYNSTSGTFVDTGALSYTAVNIQDEYNSSGEYGTRWVVKNIFELKFCERILVKANVFEYNWPQGQDGMGILLKTTDQSGSATWAKMKDVTFVDNVVRHSGSAFAIQGANGLPVEEVTNRILIKNNLAYDINAATWGEGLSAGRAFFLSGTDEDEGPHDVRVINNTLIHSGHTTIFATGPKNNYTFENNVLEYHVGIVDGNGPRDATALLTYITGTLSFQGNVIVGTPSGQVPSTPTVNTFNVTGLDLRATNSFPASWAPSGTNIFVDYDGTIITTDAQNYRINPASPYFTAGTGGTTPGADIDRIEQQTGIQLP